MALGFISSESLQIVLTSGICSADLQSSKARVGTSDSGMVVIDPVKALTSSALKKLKTAGVEVNAELPNANKLVQCWAEAVSLTKTPTEIPSLVLFVVSSSAQLMGLSSELLRLGCERQELLVSDGLSAIRATDPPTYSVVRALDRENGMRVYAPDPIGQDSVWTELGYHHPLASRLVTETGSLLLVSNDAWRAIPNTGWRGLESVLELTVPGTAVQFSSKPPTSKLKVELRLAAGRRDPVSMWVLRDSGVSSVDRLLEYLPEDVAARLSFAVATGGSGDPVVLLRSRTSGRHAHPDLSLEGEMYSPIAEMLDLYAPSWAIVEPPLRRERLRSVVGVSPDEIVWLAPISGTRGKFRVERIVESAFMPMSEWAEYVIHSSSSLLKPWIQSTITNFKPFISSNLEWADKPAPRDKPPDDKAPKAPRRAPSRNNQVAALPAPVTEHREVQRLEFKTDPVEDIVIDAELAALEAEFVAMDVQGDAPERQTLLSRLARSYSRLNRRRDAGICFARTVWESSGSEADSRLDIWINNDLYGKNGSVLLKKIIGQDKPNNDDVRLVAALAAQAGKAVESCHHDVQRWLDVHDGDLDTRTLWLSRLGLSKLSGGDSLILAKSRDRILSRLAGGLPVERELPAFLRFSGRSGALGNASGELLGQALDKLRRLGASARLSKPP